MFSSCAHAEGVAVVTDNDPSGFFWGLWHGWVAPFTFIGSLFSDNILVYDVNNTGGWYDFGFLLGCGSIGFTYKTSK